MTDPTEDPSRIPRAASSMGASSPSAGASSIARAAGRAEGRLRLRRALEVGVRGLAAALVGVAVLLVLRKVGVVGEKPTEILLALVGFAWLGTLVGAYARRLPPRAGAVALDRFHGLSDRLASALAFASEPPEKRTPFMDAAIDDGVAAAGDVDPRRAVPLRAPRDLGAVAFFAAAVVAIALVEVRTHKPQARAQTLDAVDVTADDLDAMREFLRDMDRRAESDEAKVATQEFNQLIEDLAAKRLDRTEAFRKMQALEDKLLQGREGDAKALEDALSKIGEELKKAELTKSAGEALDTKNLAAAEQALKDLAKRLREQGAKVDKAQIEKMREALKKAAEAQGKSREELEKRREELKKELLAKKEKQPDGGMNEQEKSLLQKKERELERLDRQTREQKEAERQLDRLDRELAQAAEDLAKDLGLSADDMDKAAEDINRMARQEMSQEEKEQLRQKLQELREMLRQQGQGGKQQMARLRKFQQQARGGGGSRRDQGNPEKGQGGGKEGEQGDDDGDEGDEGDGKDGQGKQGQNGQGKEGEGQEGQGQKGQGQKGQKGRGKNSGTGQGNGEQWVLGPNGEKMLMLSQGKGQGQSGTSPGDGQGSPQKGSFGSGHDDKVQGAATGSVGATQDTQVAGQDTGQGESRSEVIAGASERGFASRGYQRVFREYHTVAEEALGKDEIPGGYRFYVRRYFQLIRPREAGDEAPSGAPSPTVPNK